MAKTGKYTFMVDRSDTKSSLKSEIAKLFDVHVTDIKTITIKGESGRNARGSHYSTKPTKKAIVSLKDNEKINLFEESKK